MKINEIQEAANEPGFINNLEKTRIEATKNGDIEELYKVLDAMLIMDLDEEKINLAYDEILKISFENLEKAIKNEKKIKTKGKEFLYIRSFYEHALQSWTGENIESAKKLFALLINIVDDKVLVNILKVHLIACIKELDFEEFLKDYTKDKQSNTSEKYAYFIADFTFDIKNFIKENQKLLDTELQAQTEES